MKYLKITLLLITLNTLALADSTEDFFYKRGYEGGYNAGFEAGVKEAFKEAKAMLSKYNDYLKSYEIGKYLIKAQNLTYPQVWQEKDSKGGFRLRILPSEIQSELNVEELFAKFATIPSIQSTLEDKLELSLNEKNSVYLSNRDSNINSLPQNPNENTNKHTLLINKSAKNLEILKRANVVFSDEGETYNVLFFTNTEKENFCAQFEICR
ncbi:hypothetical protein [Helicobacter turcicus]|uniref:Periplasmic protein n=1 Tax=Helicobacter turcicus TaxID=2867412 RepID=A0ABS7JPA7_9HELI|nr:hypothetical protein [Helicobacter turcicus]MBX7491245.1 hypothetical protein [Helicobacter turcicus]MBX7546116.1 hypothetical protein [Helicobacter turcicus]